MQEKNRLFEFVAKNNLLYFLLFFLIVVYGSFAVFESTGFTANLWLFLGAFASSAVVFFLQSRLKSFLPLSAIASILVFSSFFGQRFIEGIQYTPLYFAGFAIFAALLVSAIVQEKRKEFWIILLLFFASTAILQLTPRQYVGDEQSHVLSLSLLENGVISPESLGSHHYLNVSPFYFYYLVVIAKILGIPVTEIFFFLKLFFSLLIFLSFYLLASQLSDKRIGLLAALLISLPIANMHLAPQIIGKFLILNLFIYIYLKYFKELRSRIILIFLIISLVYINLTTLYTSFVLFGIFALIYFFSYLRKRRAYLTDLALVFVFGILIFTFFYTEDVEQTASSFVEPVSAEISGNPISPEGVPVKIAPKPLPLPVDTGVPLLNGVVRFFSVVQYKIGYFFDTYVAQYGFLRLMMHSFYYLLVVLFVSIAYFKFKNNNLAYYALALFLLAGFLVIINFQEGVHATLLTLSVAFFASVLLFFSKKQAIFVVALALLFLASYSTPYLYQNEAVLSAQRLEWKTVFLGAFQTNAVGEFHPINSFTLQPLIIGPKISGTGIAYVQCELNKPYDFNIHLLGYGIARISCLPDMTLKILKPETDNSNTVKLVYENHYAKNYSVLLNNLLVRSELEPEPTKEWQ